MTFHKSLSDQSVYRRYFHMERLGTRTNHEQLVRECLIDRANTAFVAERLSPDSAKHEILAVADLNRIDDSRKAEIGILVADRYQNQGLGTKLLRSLIGEAQRLNLNQIVANVLSDNLPMVSLAKSFGFAVRGTEDPGTVVATLDLSSYKAGVEMTAARKLPQPLDARNQSDKSLGTKTRGANL